MTRFDLSGTTLLAMRSLWEQRPLIERATALGADVVAVDENDDAEGLAVADESVVVPDLRDLAACYEAATEHDVDAVVSDECDYSLFAVSYLGERLGVPAVSLNAAQRMTNKRRMREAANEAVAQPAHELVTTAAGTKEAAATVGYPCVVKPVDNRGGFGVSKVDDEEGLIDAFYKALENSHGREVLVERFVEGVPVTVDGYCLDGEHRSLAVASKNTSMGSLHPTLEITYPAQIPDSDIDRAREANDTVAEALGVEMGATHAEYIMTDDDVYLLEFQNRGGGVHTSARIVPAVTGFDVTVQLLADATGHRTGQEDGHFPMQGSVVMRFLNFDPGIVERVENVDQVRADEDILTFRLYFEEGDEIADFSAFTDSHGVIIAKGETPEAATDVIDRALAKFKLVCQ